MIEKTQLDLQVLLPDVEQESDACYQRLRDLIEAKAGVSAAHLLERSADTPSQLCVHVDPAVCSVQELRQFARRAGAKLQANYGHLVIDLAPMPAARAQRIQAQLGVIPGVLEASVSADGLARLEFDRDAIEAPRLREKLAELAGGASDHTETEHAHGGIFGEKTEIIFIGLCGLILLPAWLLEAFSDAPGWLTQSLLVIAFGLGGWFTFREAIENLRARRFEIDTLMLVAAVGAAILGEWAEGTLLLFLFGLGHALEAYAMGRAKRAIEALAELAPKTASVIRDGEISEVPVEALVVGDIVIVRPNQRLPADGFVVKGESSINQAPITG